MNLTSVNHPVVNVVLLLPEYANLLLFIAGIFGMYNGVEISHPIFSVLFANLVMGLVSTILNISGYIFFSLEQYLNFSSGCNGIFVSFHCSVWCVTSILRFIYVLHIGWIDKRFPNQNKLTAISVASVYLLFAILVLPVAGTAISLGKNKFKCIQLF
jgi:hypothetical protein